MSSPSDPPPSDSEPGPPPQMSILAAAGWTFGITMLLYFASALLLKARPGRDLVSSVACQAIAYLVGLFLILRVHAPEASIRDYVGVRRTHGLLYVLAPVLGLSVWAPASVVAVVIEKRWPLPEDNIAEMFRAGSTAWRVAAIVAVALFGPMLEEILFRGALFRGLRKSYPLGLVVLTTAWLFGAAHGYWQALIPIGLVGLVLGGLRAWSGSIVPGFLAHAAFNGASCAAMIYAVPDDAIPKKLALASAAAAALLIGLYHLVGARSAVAARARELDLG